MAGGDGLLPLAERQAGLRGAFAHRVGMAAGGDGYTMLREGLEGRDTYIFLRDIVLREMKRQQPIDFTGDERLLERKGDSLRLPDAA